VPNSKTVCVSDHYHSQFVRVRQNLDSGVHPSCRLERVEQYLHIEQEPKATQQGTPPAYWPASGSLIVRNLNARYSEPSPNILHDVSFDIRSGERIGVGTSSVRMLFLSSLLIRLPQLDGRALERRVMAFPFCLIILMSAEFLDHVPLTSHCDGGGHSLRWNFDQGAESGSRAIQHYHHPTSREFKSPIPCLTVESQYHSLA
jgi:hypothetical protein